MAKLRHEAKHETLNMRINGEERALIDRAAKIRGKNRSDFVLSAARREAEATILEQTILQVSPDVYAAFLQRLDQCPKPSERLLKTMETVAPWDKT